MYENVTVPIRIMRASLKRLRRIKARWMLREERRVSDAQVVDEALKIAERYESASKKPVKKEDAFLAHAGFIKGGPRTNATRDLDEALYGGESID